MSCLPATCCLQNNVFDEEAEKELFRLSVYEQGQEKAEGFAPERRGCRLVNPEEGPNSHAANQLIVLNAVH